MAVLLESEWVYFGDVPLRATRKESEIWDSWRLFVVGVIKEAKEALRNAGEPVWNFGNLAIAGFFCSSGKEGFLKILPLMIHNGERGLFRFSFANGSVNKLFNLFEDGQIELCSVWSQAKKDFVFVSRTFPLLGFEDCPEILSRLRERKRSSKKISGFLPIPVAYDYFFGKDEENISAGWQEKVGIFREMKIFLQAVSPSVYEKCCAQLLARIR